MVEPKERKNHDIGNVHIMKFELIVQRTSFDDKCAHTEHPGGNPECGTDAAGDDDLYESIRSEGENNIYVYGLAYFPELRWSD